MSIPFVRQFPPTAQHPKGERRLAEFICSTPEIEAAAQKFIALEGAYVCEILPDGRARVAACQFILGVQKDVEVEICDNGPALPIAVERLIAASVKHVEGGKALPFQKKAAKPRIITEIG